MRPFDVAGTRAVISLDAIAHNVRLLRGIASSPHFLAVVKANAYGHGAPLVAAAALGAGADRLGVYGVEEALVLRRAGITAPIHVFGPLLESQAEAVVAHQLIPTVTRTDTAAALQQAAGGTKLEFHLKIDTGLHRAGVLPEQALDLLQAVSTYPQLVPAGAFTHFAAADEGKPEPTTTQLRTFLDAVRVLRAHGFSLPLIHAANTGGTLDFPDSHLDMVRCGIGIYGYLPSRLVRNQVSLQPALSLRSQVVRVHDVGAGEGVGYGGEHRCTRKSRIALVPIGYGDGLPRTIGCGRGTVLIGGQSLPIVGRVSMDQITVDVTDAPDVQIGDDVVLIGRQEEAVQTADDLGDRAGTISYDILTGLLPRVPRVYESGGRTVAVQLLGEALSDQAKPGPSRKAQRQTG